MTPRFAFRDPGRTAHHTAAHPCHDHPGAVYPVRSPGASGKRTSYDLSTRAEERRRAITRRAARDQFVRDRRDPPHPLRADHPGAPIVTGDNGPAHGGDAVRDYLATHDPHLGLIRLPAYSPDFNLGRVIWAWACEQVASTRRVPDRIAA